MKKIYVFLTVLNLCIVASAQSPTCNWFPTCENNLWITNNVVKKVATAYYFAPGLFTGDTSAIDQLWDAIPGDSLLINEYVGVDGSPTALQSNPPRWSVPPSGFSSQAKLLYDDNYLYVLLKVTDPNSYLYKSDSGTISSVSSLGVEIAPYDSIAPGYSSTDYEDEFAYWNSLGARELGFYLDPIVSTSNVSGWITQHNFVTGVSDPPSNKGFYGCYSGTKIHSLGYEALLLVSFSWAMSAGATATGGGTAYDPVKGNYIAFNMNNVEYDAATAASSFVQSTWSTNNNDVWATMLYCGKVLLGPDLPCLSYSPLLDSLGLLCTNLNNVRTINKVEILTNPVTEDIQFSEEIKDVKVIDLLGKTVIEADQTQDVNVSGLENGLYVIKYVTEDNVIYVEKILKK
jgi:hypothetical protein